jgi:lysozyme family protein
MDFDRAFDILISHEGGFVHRPFSDDPGGATKYGVTEKVARANGYTGKMQDLTLDFSKSVYRKQYWDACQCDAMPDSIRYPLFDAAVNSGAGQAIKWLQASVGVKADGIIGNMTMQSVSNANPIKLAKQMLGKRLRFMTELKNWTANSRGWARRVAAILEM